MFGIIFVIAMAWLCGYHVHHGNMPLWVGAFLFVGAIVFVASAFVYEILSDHRNRKSVNHYNFVREVIAAHQRANEARQATERT